MKNSIHIFFVFLTFFSCLFASQDNNQILSLGQIIERSQQSLWQANELVSYTDRMTAKKRIAQSLAAHIQIQLVLPRPYAWNGPLFRYFEEKSINLYVDKVLQAALIKASQES